MGLDQAATSGRRNPAMKQPIALATDSGHALAVLSVTPCEEDQFWLQNIIGHSKWKLYEADHLESALAILRDHEVGGITPALPPGAAGPFQPFQGSRSG